MCIRDRYFSMDGHLLSSTYTYTTLLEPVSAIKTCFFYFLFFIFVLFFFIYIYLFSIKSIFSIVCDTTSILDIVSAVTGIKYGNTLHFNLFYILKVTYMMHSTHLGFYFFLQCFSLFLLILFSLINIFFLIHSTTLKGYALHKTITIQITKQNKFFFKLENVVVLIIFKFFKNEVLKHIQINLITFLVNFFSYFVKDITYLNSVIYFFFMELCFALNDFKNVKGIVNTINTQLTYILSLIHISEPTRLLSISYAVFCLKKKKKKKCK
eukprot:TRINITY_DN25777_c0_g1_i3.p1 TRINITY_DN25777_c0_g1~~TRINITY_DN25777_c0_g1_i3.p1  ORF type:complete len:267 (+),score=-34.29 TRINITY_DN25777_c0_g1_i3:77-877(+)